MSAVLAGVHNLGDVRHRAGMIEGWTYVPAYWQIEEPVDIYDPDEVEWLKETVIELVDELERLRKEQDGHGG